MAALKRSAGQFARFIAMSGSSALVTIGLPVLLFEMFGLAPRIGVAIAFAIAFLLNFVTLRRVVFQSRNSGRHDLAMFAASSFAFRLLEYLAFLMLERLGLYYVFALALVLAVGTLSKFFWYRFAIDAHAAEHRA